MGIAIGYKASAEEFGPRELVEYGVAAERHGFDSTVVSDHYQPWRHVDGHAPFSLAWMTAVGERTERIALGTSVLTATFRYNPAVIAQAFATMGCLYPGRIRLGIGTGEALNDVAVTGMVWPEFKERFARMREAIDLMRTLWTADRVDFDGVYYKTVGATIYDRPDQPIPVYVAAGGPVVAKYAARRGEGIIVTSGKGMDLYTEKLVPAINEGLEAGGKTAADLDRMIEIKLSYDRDADYALQATKFWAPLALSAEQKASLHDPIEMEKAADALPIEKVATRWIVTNDPKEAVEQIRPYVEAGFTNLVMHAPGADQERFMSQFAADVMPGLREL